MFWVIRTYFSACREHASDRCGGASTSASDWLGPLDRGYMKDRSIEA